MKNKTFIIIIIIGAVTLLGAIFFYPLILSKIGTHFLKYNNYHQAINFYSKAKKEGYSSSKLNANLGICYFYLGRIKEAKQSLIKALELNENNDYANYYLGLISTKVKDYPTALKYYSKTIKVNPKFIVAYNSRAGIYETLGQPDNAEQDLIKVLELDPKFAMGHFNLAEIYDHRKDIKNAIKYYNQFLDNSHPSMVELLEEANQRLVELTKK